MGTKGSVMGIKRSDPGMQGGNSAVELDEIVEMAK